METIYADNLQKSVQTEGKCSVKFKSFFAQQKLDYLKFSPISVKC